MPKERLQKPGAKYILSEHECCLLDVTSGQSVHCAHTGRVYDPPLYDGATPVSVRNLFDFHYINTSGLSDKDYIEQVILGN